MCDVDISPTPLSGPEGDGIRSGETEGKSKDGSGDKKSKWEGVGDETKERRLRAWDESRGRRDCREVQLVRVCTDVGWVGVSGRKGFGIR